MAHFNKKSPKNKQKRSQHLRSHASDHNIQSGSTTAHSACQFFAPPGSVVPCPHGSAVRTTQPFFFCASTLSAASALLDEHIFLLTLSHFYLLLPTSFVPFLPSLSSSHTHLLRQRFSRSVREHGGEQPLVSKTHHSQIFRRVGMLITSKLDDGETSVKIGSGRRFRMECGHVQYMDATKSHFLAVLNPTWILTTGNLGTMFLPLPPCPAQCQIYSRGTQ